MIRFSVKHGDKTTLTEWENEPIAYGAGAVHTAVERMVKLRETYGKEARISIERTTVIPEPDRRQVRFKIVEGEETKLTPLYPIGEQDMRLAEWRARFPKATITPEVVRG